MKHMRRGFSVYVILLHALALMAGASSSSVQAQSDEVLPHYVLDAVEIHGRPLSDEERRAYLRLVFNVRRTYPYAVLAKERMDTYNAMRRETARKKDQRKYLREAEAAIKRDFMEDLKNMTRSQGDILIKLLARQTDTTAYFLLKDFRGGLRAMAYQTVAVFWGYDLKESYQPYGRDRDIETIVRLIEQGKLSTIEPKVTPAMEKGKNETKEKKKKR